MNIKKEWKIIVYLIGGFILAYNLPIGTKRFDSGLLEGLHLLKEYARLHVILCLMPALFIAGAISVFISQTAVMKYLGAEAKKVLAYSVSSIAGTVLAVCSCTILPLFAGIYKMGAGIGPASTFLYSGPAINILAIVLTARILGVKLGIARAIGAVLFGIVIGLLMHLIFKGDEKKRTPIQPAQTSTDEGTPLWQNALFFLALVGILITATWGGCECSEKLSQTQYLIKNSILSILSIGLCALLVILFKVPWWKILTLATIVVISAFAFPKITTIHFGIAIIGLALITATTKGEASDWFSATFTYTKQIIPLLFIGVLIAGILLGRPGQEGLIPSSWVSAAVGGNSLRANLFASIAGAFMYFATLTEVPILQGLIGSGMGKGPALALLLAGPALSLPNMLVINSIMGIKRTSVFILLVVVMATISGTLYGALL